MRYTEATRPLEEKVVFTGSLSIPQRIASELTSACGLTVDKGQQEDYDVGSRS